MRPKTKEEIDREANRADIMGIVGALLNGLRFVILEQLHVILTSPMRISH